MVVPGSVSPAPPPIQAMLLGGVTALAVGIFLAWLVAFLLSRTQLADLAVKVLAGAVFPIMIVCLALVVRLQAGYSLFEMPMDFPPRTYFSVAAFFGLGWWIAARTLKRNRAVTVTESEVFD